MRMSVDLPAKGREFYANVRWPPGPGPGAVTGAASVTQARQTGAGPVRGRSRLQKQELNLTRKLRSCLCQPRGLPCESWGWGHSAGDSKGIVPVSPAGNSEVFPVLIRCGSRRELDSAVERRSWVKNCWLEFESNFVANLLLLIRIWVKNCC